MRSRYVWHASIDMGVMQHIFVNRGIVSDVTTRKSAVQVCVFGGQVQLN